MIQLSVKYLSSFYFLVLWLNYKITNSFNPICIETEEFRMNETVKNLISRKSCKSYQDKHVSKELLDEIVAAGLNAPSGMNKQTPRFVVVSDDQVLNSYQIWTRR